MRRMRFQGFASALFGLSLLIQALMNGAAAQTQTAPPANLPPQVEELLRLLEDPAIRGWIDQQRRPAAPSAAASPEEAASERMATRIAQTREHLASLAAALPRLPQEVRQAADRLSQELQGRRFVGVVLLVLGFLVLGAGTEWIFASVTRAPRERILSLPMDTVSDRVRAVGMRLAFDLAHVAIFAVGSIGAFLVFDWPPLLRHIVLAYLIAVLILRFALVAGRFLLAPWLAGARAAEHYRVIPMTDAMARFWYRRLALFVGWTAFGQATVSVVRALGFSLEARQVVAYTLGLGLLAIAVEAAWRWPGAAPPEQEAPEGRVRSHALGAWLLSVYFLLVWGLWVAGLIGLFWLAVVALALPWAIG
ncbi:MAG TPA: mechanosensitive ion channel family protein, partial [Microvirga sp.]|nr:mechanosensitive ion channel family protein [Microvirga sp.]